MSAITKIGSASAQSSTSDGFTTGSLDTSGANFIVIVVTGTYASDNTITDNKNNIWKKLTKYFDSTGNRQIRIYYAYNATVGTGHTFTVDGTTNFPAMAIAWYSGVKSSSDPFDSQQGNNVLFGTTCAFSTITPVQNNCLLIAGCEMDGNLTPHGSFNSGLTEQVYQCDGAFGHQGAVLSDLIQTSKSSITATWTQTTNSTICITIASFKGADSTIAFRSAVGTSGTGTSVIINKPVGVVDGDLMIAALKLFRNGSAVTVTPPSGWNLISGSPQHGYWTVSPPNSYGCDTYVWWRTASGEGSNYTWTLDISTSYYSGISAYSGGDQTTPIDTSNSYGIDSTVSIMQPPTVTLKNNEWVIVVFGLDGTRNCSIPSGYIARVDYSIGNPFAICDSNGDITSGFYTPPSGAITLGVQPYGAFTVGLKVLSNINTKTIVPIINTIII